MSIVNHKAVILLSSLLISYSTLPAKAESVLEQIEQTGVITLATREDAAPFGYLDANNNLQGYCLDFFALLKEELIKNLQRNTLSVRLFQSTANNRFSLVSNNIVDLECGPNTIRDNSPENTNFSRPFFLTGTQFLISSKNQSMFKFDSDLREAKLGVIKNTTTEKLIVNSYPMATVQKFSGKTARTRGVQSVAQGKIDAMISDGILLRAEAQQQELSAREYPLIPEIPLSCDRYGMIIKDQDPQWHDFVNSVISSPQAAALYQAWFGNSFDSDLKSFDACQ